MTTDPLALLKNYLGNPEPYWQEGLGWRQSKKLITARSNLARIASVDEREIVVSVVQAASGRAERRPPPVYIVNIGGSGSHWVGDMLNEIPGLTDADEVYVPDRLLQEMRDFSTEEQATIVDGIHLIHAWDSSGDWDETRRSSIVNTAHRPHMLATFRRWDPDCFVVHLFRDPRDRALSVAYRKATYRVESAPDMGDEAYLRKKAKKSDTYLRRYLRSDDKADFELRFESMRQDPEATLSNLVLAVGARASGKQIRLAVYNHDAANIRKGRVASVGNLDEGGQSRGWQQASRRDRLIMHHLLAFPVRELGYRVDDCLARDVFESHRYLPRRNLWMNEEVAVDYSTGRQWVPATSHWLPPRAVVRVAPRDGARPSDLQQVLESRMPDIVCLAGLRHSVDSHLQQLVERSGIVGLDVSGTDVSSSAIPVINSLPSLRWVAAHDTPLEDFAETFF